MATRVGAAVSGCDPTLPTARRIARLALNVRDLGRSVDFYREALGFDIVTQALDHATLALGAERIELRSRPDGAPYPEPRAANDPWFQHFAIVVADMDAAYGQLSAHRPEPITRGGPQLLPPSTGSVTAYKFRDPDGHPLELSHIPGSEWTRMAAMGRPFLGIDHTALATREPEASVAFYTRLGFRLASRSLNRGPEQARLDGLDGAMLDIVTLRPPGGGPHIELLHYRSPTPPPPRTAAPGGIAATETVLDRSDDDGTDPGRDLGDPDGHLLRFTSSGD